MAMKYTGFTQSPFTPTFTDSMDGTRRTGYPSTMTVDGKKYFLRQDTELDKRLAAGEAQSARRSGRPVQKILPNYRYVDEQGKPFQGTFLGGGSYGGFGQTEEEKQQRDMARAQRAQRAMVNRGGGPQPEQQEEVPFTPPPNALGTSAVSPLAFTGFGRTIGESAYMTPIIPPIIPSPIPSSSIGSLTSFGGVPRFPFAVY